MRMAAFAILLAALSVSVGCMANKPLSITEFNGFCYQISTNRHADCDNISVCDAYSTGLDAEHATREACLDMCRTVYRVQSGLHAVDGCGPVVDSGFDWCNRYCTTNLPGAQP